MVALQISGPGPDVRFKRGRRCRSVCRIFGAIPRRYRITSDSGSIWTRGFWWQSGPFVPSHRRLTLSLISFPCLPTKKYRLLQQLPDPFFSGKKEITVFFSQLVTFRVPNSVANIALNPVPCQQNRMATPLPIVSQRFILGFSR